MATIINSIGYENTGYASLSGVIGTKKPVLQMSIKLLIKNPPPPLFLFINPQTLDISKIKKITPQRVRANAVTSGYTIQHAFDEMDVMNVSCMSAMTYHPKYGLTTVDSRRTAGFDQTAKLLALYRNNGVNYNRKQESIIESIGRVAIFYDGVEYRGSFDSFSFNILEERPFNYEFTWSFTISETIDSNLYRGYNYDRTI